MYNNRNQSINNILCSSCAAGYSEWGPSSSCIECNEANGGYILLVIITSFILVVILHGLAQSGSGIIITITDIQYSQHMTHYDVRYDVK